MPIGLRWDRERHPQRTTPSCPRLQPLDQLPYGRDEATFIKRISAEAVGVVAGEHQFLFDSALMRNILECLLDAE